MNVFEWVWEHSRAVGLAREILLELAWDPATDRALPHWPGYLQLWFHTGDDAGPNHSYTESDLYPIEVAVLELLALEELSLDALAIARTGADLSRACPDVTYTFPAYRTWFATPKAVSVS